MGIIRANKDFAVILLFLVGFRSKYKYFHNPCKNPLKFDINRNFTIRQQYSASYIFLIKIYFC